MQDYKAYIELVLAVVFIIVGGLGLLILKVVYFSTILTHSLIPTQSLAVFMKVIYRQIELAGYTLKAAIDNLPFRAKGVVIPKLAIVYATMLGTVDQLKILNPIIRLNSVYVVNYLVSLKIPTNLLLHNQSMLTNVARTTCEWMFSTENHNVPTSSFDATTFPRSTSRSASFGKFHVLAPASSTSKRDRATMQGAVFPLIGRKSAKLLTTNFTGILHVTSLRQTSPLVNYGLGGILV